MFLYFCLWLFKSLSQMAFYFSNLILQTAYKLTYLTEFVFELVMATKIRLPFKNCIFKLPKSSTLKKIYIVIV